MVLFSKDRILVPIDFSDESFQALKDTLAFIESTSSVVHAIHVLSPLESTEPGNIWQSVDIETRKAKVQESFAESFPEGEAQGISLVIDEGEPSAEIIDYAKQHDIGLIVMPSTGKTGLSRFLMGSVTERVMRFAHCPVLVLRG
ncbi:MAG: universal stress protein [Cyanobacteria bacterium J06632_22]